MQPKFQGILLIILSALAYGAMPIFARLAYRDGLDPVSVLFYRVWIAGLVLGLLMVRRSRSLPEKPILFSLIGLGALGFVGQSIAYFTALTLAATGLVALLLYLYPALVAFFGVLFFGEKINFIKITALLLALTGGVFTVGSPGSGKVLGMVLAFLAACIYSFYILFSNKVLRKASPIQAATIIILSATVVYTILVLFRGLISPHTPTGWVGVLGVALISTVIAQWTFMAGLERIGSLNSAAILTLEPVTAILLASLVFGEHLLALQLLGGALILAAVVILSVHELKQQARQAAEPEVEPLPNN